MQVFVPFKEPLKTAQCLDKKRLNKQIIECKQILAAINGKKAWSNHPCTKMYKEHWEWLNEYMLCLEYYRAYKKGLVSITIPKTYSESANELRPSFLTDEFCDQHKRRLYAKDPDFYKQFESYGPTTENWYFVDGEIKRYETDKTKKKK